LYRPGKNIKLILNYVVGPLVFCLVLYSIFRQVQRQHDWKVSVQQIFDAFTGQSLIELLIVVFLMLLNWGIEARKWQLSLMNVQRINLGRAFKGVLTGNTMALFTPNRVGEYVGRILYIEEEKRLTSMPVTFVCSISQLIITFIAGLIGLLYLRNTAAHAGFDFIWFNVLWVSIALTVIILLLMYFRLYKIVGFFERISFLKNLRPYIEVLKTFKATVLLRMLSLSSTRFAVFMVQYYLLFDAFNVDITWWESFWAVSVVFLALAIIPSIAVFTDLGVRWKTSIELVTVYSSNTMGILAASFAIWIINLVIPALIGSLLILSIRLFRTEGRDK
jgi:hypothetical protein